MAGEVHVGDVGSVFQLTIVDQDGVAVDVSCQTRMEILFKGPGIELTKTAVFQSDGIDGVIKYLGVSGDILAFGKWAMQGHVILPAGEWYTTAVAFDVLDNII